MMKKKVLKRLAVFSTAMTILLSGTTAFAAESTYTTVSGDTLSKVAKKVYNDASKWREIYESNKDIIKNPNVIYANQTLVIPDLGITTTVTVETPAEESTLATTAETVTEETTTTTTTNTTNTINTINTTNITNATNASNMLPVRKVHYYYDEDFTEFEEYKYDVNGNVVRTSWYSEDGTLFEWIEHEYDVYNNETRRIQCNNIGYDNELSTYEYDASGRLIKENEFDLTLKNGFASEIFEDDYTLELFRRYEYEYDASGNMIKETEYSLWDGSGSIILWYEYEYDANGNMIKKTWHYSDGGSYATEYDYEYDANGNMIKEAQIDDGNITSWYEYEYDSYGNKVKEYEYHYGGNIYQYVEYQY